MKKINIRTISGCAILIALATILQFLSFNIPIMPSFIKFDFSDLPQIIGGFAYGPLAGIIICILKNVLHMGLSQSVFIGELSNCLQGSIFVLVSSLFYFKHKSKKNALIGGVLGSIVSAIFSLPLNYYLIYPLYSTVLNMSVDTILKMYQLILPGVNNLLEALLIFNVPFTLIKFLITVFICMLVYKRISPLLKGTR